MSENNNVNKTNEKYISESNKVTYNSVNREYKSRLFSFLFGREENKHWTLSLYNAIHGTSYNDLSGITINTIEDIVYMGMKNDLSILVSEIISLYNTVEIYEQQSSHNPNMPLREFMYAGKLYQKYIQLTGLNIYGKSLLPLPLPKLVVFYNGEGEQEDEVILRLSDAFKEEIRQNIINRNPDNKNAPDDTKLSTEVESIFQKADPDIEVKVRMLNINYGHNKELLTACKPLEEYAWFVSQVRKNHTANNANKNQESLDIGVAIDQAINEMPEDFEIKKYIISNRAEVKEMCLTEYNETETMEMLREEGRHESRLLDIKNLMDSTGWTAGQVMDMLKIPSNQRAILYSNLSRIK